MESRSALLPAGSLFCVSVKICCWEGRELVCTDGEGLALDSVRLARLLECVESSVYPHLALVRRVWCEAAIVSSFHPALWLHAPSVLVMARATISVFIVLCILILHNPVLLSACATKQLHLRGVLGRGPNPSATQTTGGEYTQ